MPLAPLQQFRAFELLEMARRILRQVSPTLSYVLCQFRHRHNHSSKYVLCVLYLPNDPAVDHEARRTTDQNEVGTFRREKQTEVVWPSCLWD